MKKNILYIEQGLAFGGALVVTSNIIKHINAEKYETYLITEFDVSNLGGNIEEVNNRYIIKKRCNYKNRINLSRVLGKVDSLIAKKISTYMWTMVCGLLNLSYSIRSLYIIKSKKIDLLHVSNEFNTEAILPGIILKKKIVVHVHGVASIGFFHRKLIPYISTVVAISDFIKNDLVDKGVPEDKIKVLKNPLTVKPLSDITIKNFKGKYHINDNSKCFAIFGRVVRWKGQKEFVEAAKLVIDEVDNAVAFIVGDISDGDVDYYDELVESIRNTRYENKIIFTGFYKDVASIYSIMNVIVHASIEPEPFGLVITEAMSYGIPVVASNLGATDEIIDTGINGYLVDPSNLEQFSSKISLLLRDSNLCRKMGERARKDVYLKFCPDKYINEIEKVYDSVLMV